MRNQKTPFGFSTRDGYEEGEMRRRIADCRERLRRERAARKIIARAMSADEIVSAEGAEMTGASVTLVGRGEKT